MTQLHFKTFHAMPWAVRWLAKGGRHWQLGANDETRSLMDRLPRALNVSFQLLACAFLLNAALPATAHAADRNPESLFTSIDYLDSRSISLRHGNAMITECFDFLESIQPTNPRQIREDEKLLPSIQDTLNLSTINQFRNARGIQNEIPGARRLWESGELEIVWYESLDNPLASRVVWQPEQRYGTFTIALWYDINWGAPMNLFYYDYYSRAVCGELLHGLRLFEAAYVERAQYGSNLENTPAEAQATASRARRAIKSAFGLQARFYRFYGLEEAQFMDRHVAALVNTWELFHATSSDTHWSDRCLGTGGACSNLKDLHWSIRAALQANRHYDSTQLMPMDTQMTLAVAATDPLGTMLTEISKALESSLDGGHDNASIPVVDAALTLMDVGQTIEHLASTMDYYDHSDNQATMVNDLHETWLTKVQPVVWEALRPQLLAEWIHPAIFRATSFTPEKQADGSIRLTEEQSALVGLRDALLHGRGLKIVHSFDEAPGLPGAEGLFEIVPNDVAADLLYIRVPVFLRVVDATLAAEKVEIESVLPTGNKFVPTYLRDGEIDIDTGDLPMHAGQIENFEHSWFANAIRHAVQEVANEWAASNPRFVETSMNNFIANR